VSFFVVPSFIAFLGIGDVLVAGLYRAGEFGAVDVTVVWLILIGYSFGLLASTTTRVYQSAFFALRDTATPARAALVRMLVALVAGAVLMVQFEPVAVLGVSIPAGALESFDAQGVPLGPLGLAVAASLGAWVEWTILKRALAGRIGQVRAGAAFLSRAFAAAAVAAVAAYTAARLFSAHPVLEAAVVAAIFGSVYWLAAAALGLEQALAIARAVLRRLPTRTR
jgi:putative peptidoglycan lipid II flippase